MNHDMFNVITHDRFIDHDEIWPGTLRWWTLTAQIGPLFSSTRSKYVQVLRASLIHMGTHMFCIFNHFHIWSLYVLQFGSQCCSWEVHWIFRSFYGAGLGVWRYSVTQVYATLLYSCCHSCCINSSSSRFGFCQVVFLTELQWKSIAHRCWKRYPRVGQEVRIGCEHSGQGDAMQDIQDVSRYLCLKYFEDLLFHKRTEQQIGYHRQKENLALQLWNSWSQWVSSLTVTEFVWIVSAGEGIFWCRGHWRFRTRFRMLTWHRVCHSTRPRKHSVHRVWRLSFCTLETSRTVFWLDFRRNAFVFKRVQTRLTTELMPKSRCVTRCPKVCRGVASDAEITSRLRIAGKSQNSDTQHAVSRSIVQSLNRCFYCQNISKKLSRLIKTQFNEELEAVLDRLYFVIPRDWQMVSDGTKKHCWKEQNFWMRQLRPVSSLLTMLTSLWLHST